MDEVSKYVDVIKWSRSCRFVSSCSKDVCTGL